MYTHRLRPSPRCLLLFVLAACLFAGMSPAGTRIAAADTGPQAGPDAIDWLEPQGINIVDLVDQVPDSYLRGIIISYTPGYGIVTYQSGHRSGGTVTITTTIYPRYNVSGGWNGSLFGCLAQPAKIDQLASTSPASTVRIYNAGRDVTREADLLRYVPAGKIKPALNPRQSESQNLYRYRKTGMISATFTADNQLILPSNMGCEIMMSYKNYLELTAVFTVKTPQAIQASVLGTQDFIFHSYLGPGARGNLRSLVDQLYANHGNRAEEFPMAIPAAADYLLLNFPASPADPYTAFPGNPLDNVGRLTGGSYRVAIEPGLSVDHVNAMGLPLNGHWQDIDQADGVYLRYTKRPVKLHAPEYFLPAGVPYNPCMTHGGCPASLLNEVYNTPMVMKAIYLRVERISQDLERIPVRMIGSGWSAAASASGDEPAETAGSPEGSPADGASAIMGSHRIYMPGVPSYKVANVPPDNTAGCSTLGGCGWFAPDGRMVDYIPAP